MGRKLKKIVDSYYSDRAIEIAENPYIKLGKKLGRDEFYAATLSTIVTTTTGFLLDFFTGFSSIARSTIISVVGPLSEKPGLFFHYFKEAVKEYYKIPRKERKTRKYYFKKIMKEGWPTLRADLLFHDSMYLVLMWLVAEIFQPTGLRLAVVSFMVFMTALILATTMEVNYIEIKYWFLKKKLKRKDFCLDSYYETRFRIYPRHKNHSPEKVLKYLSRSLDLPITYTGEYRDVYFSNNNLPDLNGRKPLLRFRSRTHPGSKNGLNNSVQITYTRSKEFLKKDVRSFRCFPVAKDKFFYIFENGEKHWSPKDIPNKKIAKFLKKTISNGKKRKIHFKRMIARDPKTIFISVDQLLGKERDFYVIELKIRKDLKTFRAVNDFILRNLPAEGTTFSKFRLV